MWLIKTYKSRFYCLIFGTLIFIFLSYHLAFKKTLCEYRNFVKNKNQLELVKGAPIKLRLIEERLKATEQELSLITETNKNYQINILSKSITIIGNKKLKIIDFPDLSSEISDGFTILTQQGPGITIDLLNFSLFPKTLLSGICVRRFIWSVYIRTGVVTRIIYIFSRLNKWNKYE